jgi:FdhD protein
MNSAIREWKIIRVSHDSLLRKEDKLAVEEPLGVTIIYGPASGRQRKELFMTMRTPGNDRELVTGFLIAEGIISNADQITRVTLNSSTNQATAVVEISDDVQIDFPQRAFYSNSSCGVCGKTSVADLPRASNRKDVDFELSSSQLFRLPTLLLQQQSTFDSTGGLHAVGLFKNGELIFSREDVGRHNAMDKVIGAAAMNGLLPLGDCVALLSGRASYELLQKASSAGIGVVAAVGAPSSLAVDTAHENGITLIGFLSPERFNVYTHPQRISLHKNERRIAPITYDKHAGRN